MARIDGKVLRTARATLRRADSPALGFILTVPLALLLWFLIILAAYEIVKATTPT